MSIGAWLKGADAYFLQPYQDSDQVILPGFSSYSYDELKAFVAVLKTWIPNTAVRGMDEAV